MNRRVALAVLAITLIAASTVTEARSTRTKGQYATSGQPYWRVGALNRKLSHACQRGEFGQRKLRLMTVGFLGSRGRAQTGIATSTWNLVDPNGLAQPNTTYHFFNQGYSNCKVYTSPIPRRR